MPPKSTKPAAKAGPSKPSPEQTKQVIDALQLSSKLCLSILAVLQAPPSSDPDAPSAEAALIKDVRNDFIELVTFISKECTNLSLALKPPLTPPAAVKTVETLAGLVAKFAHCLKSAPKEGPLAKEFNWTGQEVLESVQRLLNGSIACVKATTPKEETSLRDISLRLTAQVWEKVDLAKGISENELEASRKDWKATLGLLDDCLEEVKEMEESVDEEKQEGHRDADDSDDDEEDDDDSDDFRTSHPLSNEEKERAKAAYMLLRIGRLLLVRLINSTAPSLALKTPGFSSPTFLDSTRRLVKSFSESADDLAAGLEPPQEDAVELAGKFADVGRELSVLIEDTAGAGDDEKEKEKEWQTTLRTQLDKLQSLGLPQSTS
ncbi:hypothetical protein T439DRAFT_327828 [Meredithblackwellia eburnea MCA 4105]